MTSHKTPPLITDEEDEDEDDVAERVGVGVDCGREGMEVLGICVSIVASLLTLVCIPNLSPTKLTRSPKYLVILIPNGWLTLFPILSLAVLLSRLGLPSHTLLFFIICLSDGGFCCCWLPSLFSPSPPPTSMLTPPGLLSDMHDFDDVSFLFLFLSGECIWQAPSSKPSERWSST